MDNDWRECINIDQHLHIMTIKANISHLISNILLSFNASVVMFYCLDVVICSVFSTADYNDTLRQFPVKIQFPFETQQSPMFEFIVITLFLHGTVHDCSIAILNGLILTLVTYLCIYYILYMYKFLNYINLLCN